jgi:thiol-disulfide isomerase/thioredoxin
MYGGTTTGGAPAGNVCGFFSSTADRQAYGCYPENRDKDNVGHSFAFIEHLATGASLPEAHDGVLVTDQTPDVPLKTSDVYLEKLLEEAARTQGQKLDALIDALLAQAWLDKGAWESEIRLLDRIGQAFGYFSPRSVAELQEQADLLQNLSEQFSKYGNAWTATFHALTAENLKRFFTEQSDWRERTDEKTLTSLAEAERRTLAPLLLTSLADFTRTDTATTARLHLLREKADSATHAHYRMQVRLGVVLRMRALLTSIAGRVYLTRDGTAEQRKSYDELKACEALSLGSSRVETKTLISPEPFPPYDRERTLAEAVLPGWMGINFKQASQTVREKLGLKDGASVVQAVYPDSPARQAGIEAGDIILGPPDALFTEPQQIREWTMTAAIGTPATLQVLREESSLSVTITPQRYPLKWPSLPGPPKVGSDMPPLPPLTPYRGTLPAELGNGGPYLLFFWASWCGPCKASLPEVAAFEREKGIPVVAITDESPDQIDAFFEKYNGPFPSIVAVDEARKSFLAYGVNGTPTFVLADAAGKVQSTAVGYSSEKGLPFSGWSRTKKNPASAQDLQDLPKK